MGKNAERAVPSGVLLAKAVSKWADTVTWLLLSSGLTTLVPGHMRSTLREECGRIRDIANIAVSGGLPATGKTYTERAGSQEG